MAVAQTNRYETNAALAEQLQEVILDWTSLHDPEDLLLIPHPLRTGTICITTRSLGHQTEQGALAAAFIEPRPVQTPTESPVFRDIAQSPARDRRPRRTSASMFAASSRSLELEGSPSKRIQARSTP